MEGGEGRDVRHTAANQACVSTTLQATSSPSTCHTACPARLPAAPAGLCGLPPQDSTRRLVRSSCSASGLFTSMAIMVEATLAALTRSRSAGQGGREGEPSSMTRGDQRLLVACIRCAARLQAVVGSAHMLITQGNDGMSACN